MDKSKHNTLHSQSRADSFERKHQRIEGLQALLLTHLRVGTDPTYTRKLQNKVNMLRQRHCYEARLA